MAREIGILTLNLWPTAEAVACTDVGSQMDVGARSDVGRVRGNNEDSYVTAPELNLHLLSDGMGGMAFGEFASRLTVNTVLAHCREAGDDPGLPFFGERIAGVSEASNRLASGIQLANQILHTTARVAHNNQKMGATVVAVHLVDGRMSLAHVGDSRAYRLRGNYLEQLTQDHSFLAELRAERPREYETNVGNLQHLLTRAVGVEPEVEVDVSDELLIDSDTVLLCSDGLTHELSDSEIARVLRGAESSQEAADQLVALANEAGGNDNITAIVMRNGSRHSAIGSGGNRLRNWFRGRRT